MPERPREGMRYVDMPGEDRLAPRPESWDEQIEHQRSGLIVCEAAKNLAEHMWKLHDPGEFDVRLDAAQPGQEPLIYVQFFAEGILIFSFPIALDNAELMAEMLTTRIAEGRNR